MRECVEEGILQSYVDNELPPEMAERVAAHIAACSNCAEALNEVSSETIMFATAFEAEMSLDVPTVRLRERIDTAIAEINRPAEILEQKHGWSLSGWLASVAGLFKVSPRRAVGFASLIAVVAFAAIFAAIQLRQSENSNAPTFVAGNNEPTKTSPGNQGTPSPSPEVNKVNVPSSGGEKNPSSKPKRKKQLNPTLVPEPRQLPKDELAKALPGEQNYLKAIDSLTVEIQASGETSMKPTLRAEYERNLAIVDQAIDSTRRVARQHPNNADAAAFLFSSYQSKLDLLSAVAEQVRPTIATR